jgi:hypothetical protein
MKKLVKVSHPVLGVRLLTPPHAERLMAYNFGNNGGWFYVNEEKSVARKAKKQDAATADNNGNKGTA